MRAAAMAATGGARRMPAPSREERRVRRRARLRVVLWAGVLLASMATVVSRQTAGYERERRLATLRQELAVAEAERLDLQNRVQGLQTRARVTRVAAQRLGMRLALDNEVVLLPVPGAATVTGAP